MNNRLLTKKLISKHIISLLFLATSISSIEINPNIYSLVFFYVGHTLPLYVKHSIANARLFNENCNIIFLTNNTILQSHRPLIKKIEQNNIIIMDVATLTKTKAHQEYDNICNKRNITGYNRFTTERFFYIDELIGKYNLTNVFQIECDVMIYIDLEQYLHIFRQYNIPIAAPFQNDYLASMSITYFANSQAIQQFTAFIPCKLQGQCLETDMYLLASYKNYAPDQVEHLPTVSKDVIRRFILKNDRHEVASQPWKYWNHIELWNSIFDNDGIGTFLYTGKWKFNQAYFHPSWYKGIKWNIDETGRSVPYIYSSRTEKYRINSLHVASKQLARYRSIKKGD